MGSDAPVRFEKRPRRHEVHLVALVVFAYVPRERDSEEIHLLRRARG